MMYNLEMEVYIEFAIIDNLVIDYVLLYITCISARIKSSRGLIFLGSMIGTVLAVLLPILKIPKIVKFFLKLLIPAIMILTSFKLKGFKKFLVLYALLLAYTFVMGGTALGIILLLSGKIVDSLHLTYESILPVGIVIAVVIIYARAVIWLVNYILKRRTIQNFLYDVEFEHNEKTYRVTAFLDSGNLLVDTKTKLPVIIISKNSINIESNNIRKIEYSTLSCERKQMDIICPKHMKIFCHGEKKELDVGGAMIGLTSKVFKDYDALVPATIFL